MEGVSCSFGHGFRKFGYGDHAPLTEPLPKLRSMWKGPSRSTVDMEGGPFPADSRYGRDCCFDQVYFSIETDVKFTFASTGPGHWGGVVDFHPATLTFPLPY